MAKQVATDLIKTGKVNRGYIGVNIGNVDQTMAEALGLDRPRGVLTPGWDRALVSVVGMKMIVDVAVKTLRPVKPGSGTYEYTA